MKNIVPSQGGAGGDQPSFYNVKYGRSSMALTGTSTLVIATTQGAFHGMSIVNTSTSPCVVTVYDSTGSASGNIVGLISLPATTGTQWDLNTPIIARYGLVAVKSVSAAQATIFYGPKG
jgi:hypothetical protein